MFGGLGGRDWGRVLGKRDQCQLIQASRSGYNYLLTNEVMVNRSVICLIERDYLTKPNKAIARRAYQIILICCQLLLRSYLVVCFIFPVFCNVEIGFYTEHFVMTPTPNGQEISHDRHCSRPLFESTPLGALACPTSPEPFFLWEQFKRGEPDLRLRL